MNKYSVIKNRRFVATRDFLYGRLGQVKEGDLLPFLTVGEVAVLSGMNIIKRHTTDGNDTTDTTDSRTSITGAG